jgi:hypothetical protein
MTDQIPDKYKTPITDKEFEEMVTEKTQVFWLSIDGQQRPVWLLDRQPVKVEYKLINGISKLCFYYASTLGILPLTYHRYIKGFSPIKIGDTIPRECPRCEGTGKILETTPCPRIDEFPCLGKIEYPIKNIELKQVLDLDIDDYYHIHSEIVAKNHWLCVG